MSSRLVHAAAGVGAASFWLTTSHWALPFLCLPVVSMRALRSESKSSHDGRHRTSQRVLDLPPNLRELQRFPTREGTKSEMPAMVRSPRLLPSYPFLVHYIRGPRESSADSAFRLGDSRRIQTSWVSPVLAVNPVHLTLADTGSWVSHRPHPRRWGGRSHVLWEKQPRDGEGRSRRRERKSFTPMRERPRDGRWRREEESAGHGPAGAQDTEKQQ